VGREYWKRRDETEEYRIGEEKEEQNITHQPTSRHKTPEFLNRTLLSIPNAQPSTPIKHAGSKVGREGLILEEIQTNTLTILKMNTHTLKHELLPSDTTFPPNLFHLRIIT
jgi:hypothetical protein